MITKLMFKDSLSKLESILRIMELNHLQIEQIMSDVIRVQTEAYCNGKLDGIKIARKIYMNVKLLKHGDDKK
jgi:hypothetical protein